MTILDDILAVKRREVAATLPRLAELKSAARDAPPSRGFAAALRRRKSDAQGPPNQGATGGLPASVSAGDPAAAIRIIAEVKHRSPSAGVIVDPFDPVAIARLYAAAGADAISCLTDRDFFGGSIDDLRAVRAAVLVPVLRKDFIIDEVQIFEARAAGADAILLIAEALDLAAMPDLASLAAGLGMDVLAEAHSAPAAERAIACGAALVGINNRDLATFKVDLAATERLAPRVLAAGRALVAESGIKSAADVSRLLAAGADAILVGEGLLRSGRIAEKLAEFKAAR
jgi:indole-3-glycerol phosphate synthase